MVTPIRGDNLHNRLWRPLKIMLHIYTYGGLALFAGRCVATSATYVTVACDASCVTSVTCVVVASSTSFATCITFHLVYTFVRLYRLRLHRSVTHVTNILLATVPASAPRCREGYYPAALKGGKRFLASWSDFNRWGQGRV